MLHFIAADLPRFSLFMHCLAAWLLFLTKILNLQAPLIGFPLLLILSNQKKKKRVINELLCCASWI
jgi:uncharacterized membrane protein